MPAPLFNALARDVLIQAALAEVPQAFGGLHVVNHLISESSKVRLTLDRQVSHCALGVLHLHYHGCREDEALRCAVTRGGSICPSAIDHFGLELDEISELCELCPPEADESHSVMHYNDDHKLDFLTIARKGGPPEDTDG